MPVVFALFLQRSQSIAAFPLHPTLRRQMALRVILRIFGFPSLVLSRRHVLSIRRFLIGTIQFSCLSVILVAQTDILLLDRLESLFQLSVLGLQA